MNMKTASIMVWQLASSSLRAHMELAQFLAGASIQQWLWAMTFQLLGWVLAGVCLTSSLKQQGPSWLQCYSKSYAQVTSAGLNVLSESKSGAFSISASLMAMVYVLVDVLGATFALGAIGEFTGVGWALRKRYSHSCCVMSLSQSLCRSAPTRHTCSAWQWGLVSQLAALLLEASPVAFVFCYSCAQGGLGPRTCVPQLQLALGSRSFVVVRGISSCRAAVVQRLPAGCSSSGSWQHLWYSFGCGGRLQSASAVGWVQVQCYLGFAVQWLPAVGSSSSAWCLGTVVQWCLVAAMVFKVVRSGDNP